MSFEGSNSLYRSFSMDSSDEAYQYHTLQNIVGNNKEMLALVEHFFKNIHKTLGIYNSLEHCLTNQPTITQEAEKGNIGDIVTSNYKELKELSKLLQSRHEQHVSVFENLERAERKFEKKVKWNKTLRKVSNCIFVSGFVSVLTFSVVAAAIAAPPFVTALASGLLVPIGSVQKWSAELCNRRKKEKKKKMEIVNSMKIATRKSKEKLFEILNVVNDMKDENGCLFELIQFPVPTKEEVKQQGMDHVKNKVELIMKTNRNLAKDAAQHCGYIKGKGKAILEEIKN